MGVYIKGMEMPFAGSIKTIVIYPDGTVRTRRQDPLPYTAITVPPHGRLIDADALLKEINRLCDRRDAGIITEASCLNAFLREIGYAPTIIPAEGGDAE